MELTVVINDKKLQSQLEQVAQEMLIDSLRASILRQATILKAREYIETMDLGAVIEPVLHEIVEKEASRYGAAHVTRWVRYHMKNLLSAAKSKIWEFKE